MNQEATEIAVLITDKIDFTPNLVRRDKETYFILIRGTMYQEYILILNLHTHTI